MNHIYSLIIVCMLSSCCRSTEVEKDTIKNEKSPLQIVQKDSVKVSETSVIENEIELEETSIDPKPNDNVENIDMIISVAFDHSVWDNLLQKHVSDIGHVNYKGFKGDWKTLNTYIASLGDNMPNNTWKRADKLAFWINAYNALTVDLILRNYPLKSIKDIKDPWDQRLWELGNKGYTLNEIEHQILRKMKEPRIHFGIVCASYSCPKLSNKAYTSEDLEVQLTQATIDFLKDSERNNISEKSIQLSKIFKWFSKDFKTEGTIIDFINKYSDVTIAKNAKKSYKDYNWNLNE